MEGTRFLLPTGILEQDATIIDEQDDHVVLTLRVPISAIRENHALLMALSEIATGKPLPPGEPNPDPPKQRSRVPHWRYAVLVIAALALPSPFLAYSLARPGPPIEYKSVKMAKPTFKVGENIDIVFQFRRDRVCQTSFDRMIRVQLDDTPLYTDRRYGVTTSTTNGEWREFHLTFRPAKPLPPGHYFYSGLTHSQCVQGGTYEVQHPTLGFSVVDG